MGKGMIVTNSFDPFNNILDFKIVYNRLANL